MRRLLLLLSLIACGPESPQSCNSFGRGFGFGPSFDRRRPAVSLLPSRESISAGATNNFTCGQPDHFEGDDRLTVEWSFRSTQTTNICTAGGLPWFDIDAGATNSIIRVVCFDDTVGNGEELRFQVGSGALRVNCDSSDLELRGEEWTRLLVDVNLGAGTVTLYAYSYSIGLRQIALSCGTLPAAFDATSVTAQLEINPSGAFTSGAIDDLVFWDDIGPASLQQVRDYWGESAGFEGEPIDPRQAPWGAASNWITMGDHPSDTTTVLTDVIGANDCTGSLAGGFVTTWLPIKSARDREKGAVHTRAFTIANGTERVINTSNGNANKNYVGNPRLFRYGRNKLRTIYANGASHLEPDYRIHYGNSLNDGVDWFWGLGPSASANYPWSSEAEDVVEPTQAPGCTDTAIEGGNRGPQCIPIRGQHDGNDGAYLCLWNLTCTGSVNTVRPGGALVTDWHADTVTWTEDQTAAEADVFFPVGGAGNTVRHAIGGNGVELPNGDFHWLTYGHNDTGCTQNQIRRWVATADPHDNASWAHAELLGDGCGTVTVYRPVEPSLFRWIQAPGDGTPNIHGRVYATWKGDDITPPGAAEPYDFTCIYTDTWAADPTDSTPDWEHCDDGTAASNVDQHWTYGEGSNHNRIYQLTNGTLFIVGRETVGTAATSPNHVIFSTSIDRGATWTLQGRVTEPNEVTGGAFPRAGGHDGLEIAPNIVGTLSAQERDLDGTRTRFVYGEVDSQYIPTGPLTWSNDGWCRFNDGGASNEGIDWGVFASMQGVADGSIAFRYHTDDGAADKTIIAQGTDWQIRHLSTEALAIDMDTYHCETAASAIATNTNYDIAIGKDGTTLTLYVNGSAVACDQNVANTVPATWPASTARIRIGVAADDSEDCVDCFVDEITIWDGIAFASAARAATLIGEDRRLVDIDDDGSNDGPTGYLRCENENGALSEANGRDISEDFGYAPVWGHDLNLDAGDLGATP